ncbi:MAG: adenylyltransferase/cytidyltransferase family protein, partial [Opitutales bacterium]|nr:adenylyltransferase/cytidyltransferase family protein [Opitutales bacterium]
MSKKLILFQEASKFFDKLREQGKKLVQCHGTFDLIHPGHVIHFEEAKEMGDVLVVTITGEEFVNKGPGRPYFNDQMRVKSLVALKCIDYVVVIPFSAAVEAIECVKPDYYCKGKEYENPENDVTGNICDDVAAVEKFGGEIKYVGSVVFSSTRLLNNHFDVLSSEIKSFCQKLAADINPDQFRNTIDGFSNLKVLVIGDIIFDRYTTVEVQGLTSKNRILSGRYREESTQAGGSLASLRHVLSFAPHCKLIGIVGTESWVEEELNKYLPKKADRLVRSEQFTTVLKQRFVEPQKEGIELNKLFSVNYLDRVHPNGEIEASILQRVESEIENADVVLVMDFGHGVMSQGVRDL